ncbi:TIGR03086 family metal-binding protein [Streptomyces paludis]|uniref:TIGR03086 family protein n=1 Tax=Streptomyces paludis TaxID=2282738 RepID=A0A345HP27_9ACTN|nr:TIGR03086 family metal-binding protein [Streptomyces paludis]AXG78451.1 TIGR03086 family protein [Streptomyces paludis]
MNDKISNLSELLAVAGDRTVAVVRGITDEQLAAATPCGEYDVDALVGHLLQVVENFQELARKRDADFGTAPERLTGEWRDRFAAETVRLVAAWAAPDAEEGMSGAMGLPARTVGAMALGDLTVHGWDLARATGQPYEPDAAVVAAVGAEFAALAPMARSMGVFGEPVAVAEGAGPFAELLGLTGRDPRWTRPETSSSTAAAGT